MKEHLPVLQIAVVGTLAASLEEPMRRHLTTPCKIIVTGEAGIIPRLAEVDVLVTMAFTAEMARSATRLKLVQVPGAGLDQIDRSALPDGALLANAYGHETGIAEYVIGAMLALSRDVIRLGTPAGRLAEPMGGGCNPAPGMAGARGQDYRNPRLRQDRPECRAPRSRLRYEYPCHTPRYPAISR
jgi:hypothetical protein